MERAGTLILAVAVVASLVLGLLQLMPTDLFGSEGKLCPPPTMDCFKLGDICKGTGVCKCGLYLFCLIAE